MDYIWKHEDEIRPGDHQLLPLTLIQQTVQPEDLVCT
jgi:hypothetical protein